MILKKIKLYNFRQFYGSSDFNISTDPYKNITLIHGENGIGKTTLLNAIKWCFFGSTALTSDFENKDELVSIQAVKEGDLSCHVEITIVDLDKEYRVFRKHTKGKKAKDSDFSIYEIIGGSNQAEVDTPVALINNILPPDMAEYFFFHGEGLSSINSTVKGKAFRKAIRDILGFTFAEKAVEDLAYIAKKKEKEIHKIADISKAAELALNSKQKIDEEITKLQLDLENIQGSLDVKKIQQEEFEERLRNSDYKLVREKNRLLSEFNNKINSLIRDRASLTNNRKMLIQKYGWIVFSNNTSDNVSDLLNDKKLEGKIPAPYEDIFINDLLSKKVCVCGRDLLEGTPEHSCVMNIRDTANNSIINQKLLKARTFLETVKEGSKQFLIDLDSLESKISALDKKIGNAEVSRDTLTKELENFSDDDNVGEWQKNISRLKVDIEKLLRRSGEIKNQITVAKNTSKSLENKLYSEKGKLPELMNLEKYVRMINEIKIRCEERLKEYETSSKHIIADEVNRILKKFSRKDYSVKLSENYEFFLIRDDGKKVAKSKGENLLLNLSFISALIKHAKDRESASGEFLISGAIAPFVIDAPFGELDETYKGATSEFLPNNSNQLILLLSSSHWHGTVENSIRERIGSEYVLISNRASPQGDKPNDEITICGKKYLQSKYQQKKEMTEVLEVKT
ncbi:hypothetical protein EOL70_15060 [Leucothrix sargassi]|nr:hypothetical protein EOL70_15060 [Leucothrix sargassi]